jgi:DNA helicase IV
VFHDPNQNIYGGSELLGLQPAALTWNCRNTARIASYSSELLDQEPKVRPEAPQGETVEVVRCEDDQAMKEAVRKALHRFVVDERLDPNRVVILSPRSTSTSVVWKAGRLGNLKLVEHPGPAGPNEVIFASLQRFKGLEADAIILCEVDRGQTGCSPAHLYVGSSRARHLLVVAEYQG